MKRLHLLAVLLLLVSCSEKVEFNVVNSEWATVKTVSVPVEQAYAKSLAMKAEVADYNEATNDDQQTLFEGEVEPPTGPATVYVAYDDTNEVKKSFTCERYELAEKKPLYYYEVEFIERDEGRPASLYIDKMPPAPTGPPPPPDPYVIYAIYKVQLNTGGILGEEHPGTLELFLERRMLLGYDVELHNRDNPLDPWELKTGYIYTPPEAEE